MMTSPGTAGESVLMARTKALKSKLTSIFATAPFTYHLRNLMRKLPDRLRIFRNIGAIDLPGQGKKANGVRWLRSFESLPIRWRIGRRGKKSPVLDISNQLT